MATVLEVAEDQCRMPVIWGSTASFSRIFEAGVSSLVMGGYESILGCCSVSSDGAIGWVSADGAAASDIVRVTGFVVPWIFHHTATPSANATIIMRSTTFRPGLESLRSLPLTTAATPSCSRLDSAGTCAFHSGSVSLAWV